MNNNRFKLNGKHGEYVEMLGEDGVMKLYALCCKKCVREDLEITTFLNENPEYSNDEHYSKNGLTYLAYLVKSYNSVKNDFLLEEGLLGGTVTKITKRLPRGKSNRALVKRGKRVVILTDDFIDYCISEFDLPEKEIMKYGNEQIGARGVARTLACWNFCEICLNLYFRRY